MSNPGLRAERKLDELRARGAPEPVIVEVLEQLAAAVDFTAFGGPGIILEAVDDAAARAIGRAVVKLAASARRSPEALRRSAARHRLRAAELERRAAAMGYHA